MNHLEKMGYLFYVVNPNKTSFETVEEVPQYSIIVVPYFLGIFILESIINRLTGKPTFRINDGICSISQGLIYELARVFLFAWRVGAYVYVYSNWRLVTLPWNSLWTWWICFLAVDFLYYWGHRASHEIKFLWAHHQVHHSSEDYNLTTATRQSIFQTPVLTVFYLPMALAIPPSVYLVHINFNLLYQFWIHTEVIKSLGPLEYIINTASHHRVHHGRNRYCIDKNYAGTLIIWDRLFGTFEAEKEEVVYGLTEPINTFEPFYIQFFYFVHIWRAFCDIKGWKNKLSAIFKGPGWSPGKPWHGSIEDIPEVSAPIEKYNPLLPERLKLYALMHFVLIVFFNLELLEPDEAVPRSILCSAVFYQLFSLSVLAILLEGRSYAPYLELLRCVAFVAIDAFYLPYTSLSSHTPVGKAVILTFIRAVCITSSAYWLKHCYKRFAINFHKTLKNQ